MRPGGGGTLRSRAGPVPRRVGGAETTLGLSPRRSRPWPRAPAPLSPRRSRPWPRAPALQLPWSTALRKPSLWCSVCSEDTWPGPSSGEAGGGGEGGGEAGAASQLDPLRNPYRAVAARDQFWGSGPHSMLPSTGQDRGVRALEVGGPLACPSTVHFPAAALLRGLLGVSDGKGTGC